MAGAWAYGQAGGTRGKYPVIRAHRREGAEDGSRDGGAEDPEPDTTTIGNRISRIANDGIEGRGDDMIKLRKEDLVISACASKEKTRYALNGVRVEGNRLIATDGRIVAT